MRKDTRRAATPRKPKQSGSSKWRVPVTLVGLAAGLSIWFCLRSMLDFEWPMLTQLTRMAFMLAGGAVSNGIFSLLYRDGDEAPRRDRQPPTRRAEMTPNERLEVGRQILDAVMQPHGFRFRASGAGSSSGGDFSTGAYVRDRFDPSASRRLELHFRHTLGGVTYYLGRSQLDHGTYMRQLGVHREAAYPGFSEDPIDGFRHLAHDLSHYCQDFLCGTGREFERLAREMRVNPDKFKGFKALSL